MSFVFQIFSQIHWFSEDVKLMLYKVPTASLVLIFRSFLSYQEYPRGGADFCPQRDAGLTINMSYLSTRGVADGGVGGSWPPHFWKPGGFDPPDSRMKWPKSSVFSDFYGILG